MKTPATITYALLGLLSLRSWTGYELTKQARSTIRLVMPSSEANIYREQQRLVRLGWATSTAELTGRRARTRYTITPEGRDALNAWLTTPPTPPTLEVEAFVRLWFADQGRPADVAASLDATAAAARAALADAVALATTYLDGTGAFPERTRLNLMVGEFVTDVLALIAQRCEQAAAEISAPDAPDDMRVRERLRRLVDTHGATGTLSP